MQPAGRDVAVRRRMEEMRIVCEREVPIQQRRIDTAKTSFKASLGSVTAKSQQTLEFQAKVGKLKAELREMEDALVKALAAKTRKEAKKITAMDSLSVTKARIEELKGIVEDQRSRKVEYEGIINQQSQALMDCQEKYNQSVEHREQIEEAISWYNKVLGFRIECGHGVKFIFTNINSSNPDEEYSFTIRHENDVYTLLHCDPGLKDTKEPVNELNKSNGLFKFVRTMREKFLEFAASGICSQITFDSQDTSTISMSAPVSSVSTDCRSDSQTEPDELQPNDSNRQTKKANRSRASKHGALSPRSALSLRRSPRVKSKK